ncbi:MAG TPA: hypothetical protein ENI68_11580 [Gammaproteobacteria bacterium]|nr:hypothetical protein [Gammaproteobacteria bacterium]
MPDITPPQSSKSVILQITEKRGEKEKGKGDKGKGEKGKGEKGKWGQIYFFQQARENKSVSFSVLENKFIKISLSFPEKNIAKSAHLLST